MESFGGSDTPARDEELEIGTTSAQAHMKVRPESDMYNCYSAGSWRDMHPPQHQKSIGGEGTGRTPKSSCCCCQSSFGVARGQVHAPPSPQYTAVTGYLGAG